MLVSQRRARSGQRQGRPCDGDMGVRGEQGRMLAELGLSPWIVGATID